MNQPKRILPIIVLSQFCCTSLWFAGNGVMSNLVVDFDLADNALSHLTSSVQFGFILGTFIFAIFTISDRYSPAKVFFVSAVLASMFNLAVIWGNNGLTSLLGLRFFTGFFLAGIYPVGMKIATDYFEKGLGKSLGYLVGALVLGTAFPHLLSDLIGGLDWHYVMISTSLIAILGGLAIYIFVPDGPYRKPSQGVQLSAAFGIFKGQSFRSAAFGYFGHMWELYAFWAFVPVILKLYNSMHPYALFNISSWSFIIIGIGGIACVMGGYISQYFGTQKTAFSALLLSGICCIISPIMFSVDSEYLFISYLMFWGMMVIADSPLFSTMIAQNATPEIKGTALTLVNSIGFALTIVSIQVINGLDAWMAPENVFLVLVIGPVFGLVAMSIRKTSVS
jgi:MFS family permease